MAGSFNVGQGAAITVRVEQHVLGHDGWACSQLFVWVAGLRSESDHVL